MSQTVIGIFNSSSEAQHAVEQLVASGFSRDNVDVSSGSMTGSASSSTNLSGTSSLSSDTGNDAVSGIGRFFKNLFGSDDDESDRYTRAGERGSVVTVHAKSTEEAQRVATLLDSYGAVDVDDDDRQNSMSTPGYSSNADIANSIPVIEETLQVGKKEVTTGGVRLKSRIIEKPVEESLRRREEHVRVEGKTVDRMATDADLAGFKDETIELTERAEIPVVSKEARIVEEISLGKDVEHRDETISETVRKTEVDIEDIEADKKNRNIL